MTLYPTPPRYLPSKPLPSYAFVAGRAPHPRREPDGHSHGLSEPEAPPLDADSWAENEAYLWGIDLFNHGYYWEAHEQWEALWHAAGRQGRDAQMLKALIKLAAASLKRRQGRERGVQIHCDNAMRLLQQHQDTAEGDSWYGLSVTALMALAQGLKALAGELLSEEEGEAAVIRTHGYLMRLDGG